MSDNIPAPSDMELRHSELATKVAEESIVLLENKNDTLPINTNDNVALFGGGAYGTLKGGTGSGDVHARKTVNIWEGLKNVGFNVTTEDYLNQIKTEYDNQEAEFNKTAEVFQTFNYSDLEIDEATMDNANARVGIYVIIRNAGEGYDRKNDKGDYKLSDNELINVQRLAKTFERSIVLLNVGGIIDTKWIADTEGIDAVLNLSQTGQNIGTATANILSGKVTPSGKLADTWAHHYRDYPSSETFSDNDGNTEIEPYTEGIFVGYRYFDTFNIAPNYEFGFGKSYTDFSIETQEVKQIGEEISVTVNVKNIGSKYSGKEIVQVYYSAPDGNVDKAYQNLIAFGKTKLLKPGESQTLTIKFNSHYMSSYREVDAAYIMTKGDYILRVGNSSRKTEIVAVMDLNDEVVIEKLSNQLQHDEDPTEIHMFENRYDKVPESAVKFELKVEPYQAMESAKDAEVQFEEKDKYTLLDVFHHRVTMDQFVKQFDAHQLSYVVNGSLFLEWDEIEKMKNGSDFGAIGDSSSLVHGASGQTTDTLEDYGVPAAVDADGPAGLRVDQSYQDDNGQPQYQFTTAWPISSAIAQSWNLDLMQQVGHAIAEEMREINVDTILAPGMNIHRNPLNGRNFEYFSEDPLVTGVFASAETRGIQSIPGFGVTIKHFAANNQENDRFTTNSMVGEQALREIYLKGFEIAVKNAQPQFVMTSYNKLNGGYTASNEELITNVLRGEWNYQGTVMTDWYCSESLFYPEKIIDAGNNLIMPGGLQLAIEQATQNDEDDEHYLSMNSLRESAKHVFNYVMHTNTFAKTYNVEVKSNTPENVETRMTVNGEKW